MTLPLRTALTLALSVALGACGGADVGPGAGGDPLDAEPAPFALALSGDTESARVRAVRKGSVIGAPDTGRRCPLPKTARRQFSGKRPRFSESGSALRDARARLPDAGACAVQDAGPAR